MQRQPYTGDMKFKTAKHHAGRLAAMLQKVARSKDIGFATVAKLRHLLEAT